MIRNIFISKRYSLSTLVILAICAVTVTGCSNSGSDSSTTSSAPPPPAAAFQPKLAATGPAIATKLKFNQLALESAVVDKTESNGVSFKIFEYCDASGKVYKCRLPVAMSEGEYTPDEWIRTFSVYKLPSVVKQKKVVKKPAASIDDLPLVAPKQGTTQGSSPGAPSGSTMPPGSGVPMMPPTFAPNGNR